MVRVCTFREFVTIVYLYFIKRNFDSRYAELHRLFIFSTACSDKGMTLKKNPSDLLLIRWDENGKELKMLVRKYTRDLMVFSEIFLDDGYLSYLKNKEDRTEFKFIIDAGANIGCSVVYLSTYFENAQFVCVEPEYSNFNLLIKNVQINGLSTKVKCVNKAIWNTVTRLYLKQRDWSSDAYHVMDKDIDDEVISTTETTTISNILNDQRVGKIDFLKMDIEGAEKALFEDDDQLKEYLPNTKCIALEVHEEFISTARICRVLETYGFKFEVLPMVGDSAFVVANKN